MGKEKWFHLSRPEFDFPRLTNFRLLFHFYTPEKIRKPPGGSIKFGRFEILYCQKKSAIKW